MQLEVERLPKLDYIKVSNNKYRKCYRCNEKISDGQYFWKSLPNSRVENKTLCLPCGLWTMSKYDLIYFDYSLEDMEEAMKMRNRYFEDK